MTRNGQWNARVVRTQNSHTRVTRTLVDSHTRYSLLVVQSVIVQCVLNCALLCVFKCFQGHYNDAGHKEN